MKRKIVLMLLASMLLTQSIPVSAQEVGQIEEEETNAGVNIGFTKVSDSADLSQIVVTLPARMDLSIDDSKAYYRNDAEISAKGDLKADWYLTVKTSDSVSYESETAPNVTGSVSFGTQTWTPEQLEAGKTVPNSRDISVAVENSEAIIAGNYSGVMSFDISVKEDLSSYPDYVLDDIRLCTIDGDKLIIPASIKKDGVRYKVTAIADSLFYNRLSTVTEVIIPDTVTSIGNSAFSNCSNLVTINIPDGVTSIGNSAFSNCSNLVTINIPDGVTSIGRSAFSNCSNLVTINIPDGVTSIGRSAFYVCNSLTEITIPSSVTSVEESAFSCCSGLTTVTISEGVASIGQYAFGYCRNLSKVNIPSSITSFSYGAFEGCDDSVSIDYSGTKAQFKKISGYYNLSGKTIHCTDGDLYIW